MPRAAPALHRYRIAPPVPFRLATIVRSHGWVELAPWRWDGAVLARRERIAGRTGTLAIRQTAPDRLAITWLAAGGAPPRDAIAAVVGRALSWDWDHRPFCALAHQIEPAAATQVAGGAGRLLRGTSFYEDFVKTVCTINTSWAGTCKMAEQLVRAIGRGVFPTPGQVLRAGEAVLREQCRMGFRAPVLIGCTERLVADGAIDAQGHGTAQSLGYDYLVALKGIGPYAAAHCRVLLHDFSRLPVDSVVTAHLRETLGLHDPDAVEAHFAPWGDFRFLAYRLRRNAARAAAGNLQDGW